MRALPRTCVLLCAVSVGAAAVFTLHSPSSLHAGTRLCTLLPGTALAVVRVEQDTTLPFMHVAVQRISFSGMRPGPGDSLLATPGTPMPAARVRLLQLDSATRRTLAGHGITDSQPVAFIKAAPYRGDCRTIRWTDTIPFVQLGEIGYVRAILAVREQWIGGAPLLVIPDAWNYPYPRRRALAFRSDPDAPLAPPEALFSFETSFQAMRRGRIAADSATRGRAMEWARTNLAVADLEPLRAVVRSAVLDVDWRVASAAPSRLRGTYRVELDADGKRATWYFRTHDKPGYPWRGPDSLQSTAELLASPYVRGYQLVGHAAAATDSLSLTRSRPERGESLVWLAINDMPTAPGNDARQILPGLLEFRMTAAPERLWNDLETFVPRASVLDSTMRARMNRIIRLDEKQPRLPITVVLDDRDGVRADTTLSRNGRTLRVVLRRIDTLSLKRPF